jgi:hypothetical protein
VREGKRLAHSHGLDDWFVQALGIFDATGTGVEERPEAKEDAVEVASAPSSSTALATLLDRSMATSDTSSAAISHMYARQVSLFVRQDDDSAGDAAAGMLHPLTGLLDCLTRPTTARELFSSAHEGNGYADMSSGQSLPRVAAHRAREVLLSRGLDADVSSQLLWPWEVLSYMFVGLRGAYDNPGSASTGYPSPSSAAQLHSWFTADDPAFLSGEGGNGALAEVAPQLVKASRSGSGGLHRSRVERRLLVAGLRLLNTMAIRNTLDMERSGSWHGAEGVPSDQTSDELKLEMFVRSQMPEWFASSRGVPPADPSRGHRSSALRSPPFDAYVDVRRGASSVPLWPMLFVYIRAGRWETAAGLLEKFAGVQEAARQAPAKALAKAARAVGYAVSFAGRTPTPEEADSVRVARGMAETALADASSAPGEEPNPHCPFRLLVLNILGLVTPSWSPEGEETFNPLERLSDEIWLTLLFSAARPLAALVSPTHKSVTESDLRTLGARLIPRLELWHKDEEDEDEEDTLPETIEHHAYTFAASLLLLQRFEWAIAVLALHGSVLNPVSHVEDAVHLALALYSAGLLRVAPSALILRADSHAFGKASDSSSGDDGSDGGVRYACGGLVVRQLRLVSEHVDRRPPATPREALFEDASCHGDVSTVDHLMLRKLLVEFLVHRMGVPMDPRADLTTSPWAAPASGQKDLMVVAQRAAAYPCCLRESEGRLARSVLVTLVASSPLAADSLAGSLTRSIPPSSTSTLALEDSSMSSSSVAAASAVVGNSFLPVSHPYLLERGVIPSWDVLERLLIDAASMCEEAFEYVRAADLYARAFAVDEAASVLLKSLAEAARPGSPHREELLLRAQLLIHTVHLPSGLVHPTERALARAMRDTRDEFHASFEDRKASLAMVVRIAQVVDLCFQERYAQGISKAYSSSGTLPALLPSLARQSSSGLETVGPWLAFESAHPNARPAFHWLLLVVALSLRELQRGGMSDEIVQMRVRALRATSHPSLSLPSNFASDIASALA